MKKAVILVLLSLLCLTSCTAGGMKMGVWSDNGQRADKRMEQVFEALKAQDKEALTDLFSKKAKKDAPDFSDSVDTLFEFIQGNVESWERHVGPGALSGSEYGQRFNKVYTWYMLHTDEEDYVLFTLEYTVDTKGKKAGGLYTLWAVLASEDGPLFRKDEVLEAPGIRITLDDLPEL